MASRIVIEDDCLRCNGRGEWATVGLWDTCGLCKGSGLSRRVLDPGSDWFPIQWCAKHQSNFGGMTCDYALWKGYDNQPPNECERVSAFVGLDALAGGDS